MVEADLDDGKFVTAQPCHGVVIANMRAKALGDRPQQCVADLVAERVVDVLEPIEVERQHRQRPIPAVGSADSTGQLLRKQDSVRQAGECVV